MIAIDRIVPSPNITMYRIPDRNELVVGSRASITAAVPARPCRLPIMKDFTRKNGLPGLNIPCVFSTSGSSIGSCVPWT